MSQIHVELILADLVHIVSDLKTSKNVCVNVQMDFKEILEFLVNLFLIPVTSPSNVDQVNLQLHHMISKNADVKREPNDFFKEVVTLNVSVQVDMNGLVRSVSQST